MNTRLRIFIACGLVLLVALAGYALVVRNSGSESDSTSVKSGVRGVVKDGGCGSADSDSCVFEPVAANQRVVRANDEKLVKEFRSESDGSFQVELPPGEYIIEPGPDPDKEVGFGKPVLVEVPQAGFTEVTIVYENGRY